MTSVQVVSLAEMARRLDVTPVTIDRWRKGSSKRPPLLVVLQPKGTQRHWVHVDVKQLVLWLTAYRPDLLDTWNRSVGESKPRNIRLRGKG